MAIQFPKIIVNNTQGSVVIHDLRSDIKEPGLHIAPPVAGEAPHLYYIEDMFGEKLLRASQGLRHALEKKLVRGVTLEEVEKYEHMKCKETLTDRLEAATGKIPARRKAGEKQAQTVFKDPQLVADIQAHVAAENDYDRALVEKRADLRNDIVS